MARGCTSHCMNCDKHFTSDTAHSMHRAGSFRPGGMRHCMDPADVVGLESYIAVCKITEGKAKGENVRVWFDVEGRERAHQAFR